MLSSVFSDFQKKPIMFNPTKALASCLGLIAFSTGLHSQSPEGTELFEKEIRPVLADKCYGCHSSKLKSPMGGLVLDTKRGLQRGGNGGPVVAAGNPASSRLLQGLSYKKTDLRLPPTG